ncbi:MAG: CalY family protein [Patescibacteria group bacterium]|nr:CalY family protein [Patescibacteria group bacterium]
MKKIIMSLASIATVASMAVGSTGAYFSSEISTEGSTFSTGTLTLSVNGGEERDEVSLGGSNLAPGQPLPEYTFDVANTGSLDANHLDLRVSLSGDTELAKYIVFSGNTNGLRFGSDKAANKSVRLDVPGWTAGDDEYGVFNGNDGSYITGPNAVAPRPTGTGNGMDRTDNDGKVTLSDLAAGKVRITPGTVSDGIRAGSSATLWINAKMDPSMPDSMQGKTVNVTFTWTLHQDASQY